MITSSDRVKDFSQGISGLRPHLWWVVGSGFVREEVKALVLSQGQGFLSEAILTLEELCMKLTGVSRDSILKPSSRQEVLRTLLAEPRIISKLPEFKQIRRQRNFLHRLDQAMQVGRLSFAHMQEEAVFNEFLAQRMGSSPFREDLKKLRVAYEVWLKEAQCYDLPTLIHEGMSVLSKGWPPKLRKPQEILIWSVQKPESLERDFWERLGEFVSVRSIQSLSASWSPTTQIQWQRWHTLDSAAEALADEIFSSFKQLNGSIHWSNHAILIPDLLGVRRSLNRALNSRGIPLADLRDPTRLRWDESVKWALLPLEVVARGFERKRVISWLKVFQMKEEFFSWVKEIQVRGIRQGLHSYSGGLLSEVYKSLVELDRLFGGRRTCQELAQSHEQALSRCLSHFEEQDKKDKKVQTEILVFFKTIWETLIADMGRVGMSEKRAPLLFWFERLLSLISQATPPIEQLKPREGVGIYRLQQAPLKPFQRVWIFGLPQNWFNGVGTGTYWWSEREREILSAEFAVRSSVQVHNERLNILLDWIKAATQVTFLDDLYSVDGSEKESILPLLKELELALGQPFPAAPLEMGSHPRFSKSYGLTQAIPPQVVELPAMISGVAQGLPQCAPELSATLMDRYSRCSFQALGFHRWKLRDLREPDTELWPDVRGNLLHEAVRILMESSHSQGCFGIRPSDAIERAWCVKRPQGLIRSDRVERYLKSRMTWTLETFCQKEKDYIQRAQTKPMSLDQDLFQIRYPDFTIMGQPDRIDQHAEGLFVIDYKTSGTVPQGREMVEDGYRLQLPFYAVALQKKMGLPVIGAQFVELDRRGARSNGIFFKKWNGKGQGCLTYVRANSKSLISGEPAEIWAEMEKTLIRDAQGFLNGFFEARPRTSKKEKECGRCILGDLCGFRRR